MKLLKKYKKYFSDVILNMIGFGIYIISQQVLLMPILAKTFTDELYAIIVLYISILNVVCNVTGGELGNVRLIMDSEYKKKKIIGDFTRILVYLSPIIMILLFPLFIYLKYSIIGSIALIVTILMANVRLYATSYYRLENKFNKVIWQNVCYLIGIIVNLIYLKFNKNIYIILLIPEFISLLYALKNSDLLKMKLQKTEMKMKTLKKYFELGLVSLLNNLMNYIDKFLVYPILGATSVAVYYAVNSMSKIISLITNPMANIILSWISNTNGEKNKNKVIKLTFLINIPVIIFVTILTIPLTYIALKILYNQYISQALVLIIPVSIITAFGTASTLTKSVLLKFSNTKRLLFIYIVYFIIFIILGYNLSKQQGVVGFAIANLISRIILWGAFICLLIKSKNTEDKEKEYVEENK